jgi:cell wall-associated NlpC family hydrolase
MQFRHTAARFIVGLTLISTLLTTPAFAATGTVSTGGSALRVRTEAGTTGSVVTTISDGTQVEVLSATDNGWYQISTNDTTGYVSGDYLKVSEEDAADLPVEQAPVYIKVTVSSLNVRSGPGTDYDKVSSLSSGRVVKATELVDGWYHIENGYVSADYVTEIDATEATSSSKAQDIVDFALSLVGCRYVYGGSSPSGFDCSGFTKYVYSQFGYTINRTASTQLDNGVSVSRDELQPGDLVMFKKGSGGTRASHVGLYIGNGKFVHASTSRVGVIVSSLSEAYYTTGFVGARRIL